MAASDKTKKWLEYINKLILYKDKLKMDINDIKDMHDSVYESTAQPDKKDVNAGIKTNIVSDRTGNKAIDICETLPNDLNRLEVKLIQVQNEIEEAHETLGDCLSDEEIDMKVQEYDVLHDMYFEDKTILELQDILHYSETSIRNFHKEGIKNLHKYREKVRKIAENCGKLRDCAD